MEDDAEKDGDDGDDDDAEKDGDGDGDGGGDDDGDDYDVDEDGDDDADVDEDGDDVDVEEDSDGDDDYYVVNVDDDDEGQELPENIYKRDKLVTIKSLEKKTFTRMKSTKQILVDEDEPAQQNEPTAPTNQTEEPIPDLEPIAEILRKIKSKSKATSRANVLLEHHTQSPSPSTTTDSFHYSPPPQTSPLHMLIDAITEGTSHEDFSSGAATTVVETTVSHLDSSYIAKTPLRVTTVKDRYNHFKWESS
ncbi:hypothetical protein L1987_13024 [Smallanthus sonchifolius]|uniref:Uncharacterized protein n=1 Tax=Smallanthus sonchifolius TaxID=185202 RepID=A0ACB9JG81_9ASTR|nr:hypothetical protein L1987_13024 [Smallanthus sonchifolius]